ncbi:methicillin resistance protein [Tersicoccus phoenicis]|uniref:Methicillin resistance protein n=1 Tax=Tersicoccus phoenicis TaxID=554083 RepID=A0A1R1L8H8_9MICC|nr:peptidoglycan bridge formation glycyltransferase FemA/FemB family protein [Tersicoccus phoenicis]OMH23814.1 methicillin resistance protein [Tersicoccus phoenicis]
MSQNRATVTPIEDRNAWDAAVEALGGHPLQLWGWGEVKAAHGWQVERLLVTGTAASGSVTGTAASGSVAAPDSGAAVTGTPLGAAEVAYRSLPWPLRSLAYVSRGPVGDPERAAEVLDAVAAHVKATRGSVALVVEPDWEAGSAGEARLTAAGFHRTDSTILIPRTLILDLTRTEDELMAAMHRTTRANVRKNLRSDLEFRRVASETELEKILALYRDTAARAGFGIHGDDYYRDIWRFLGENSPIVAAFDGGEPIAFVWIARSGSTAFELYGGVSPAGQKARANYGVKWAAFTEMKADGCTRYDLNGLLNDGISDFKKQFAQHEDQLTGTWDLPLSPLYPVYARAMPLARKAVTRARPAAKAALAGAVPAARRVVGGALPAVRSLVSKARSRSGR